MWNWKSEDVQIRGRRLNSESVRTLGGAVSGDGIESGRELNDEAFAFHRVLDSYFELGDYDALVQSIASMPEGPARDLAVCAVTERARSEIDSIIEREGKNPYNETTDANRLPSLLPFALQATECIGDRAHRAAFLSRVAMLLTKAQERSLLSDDLQIMPPASDLFDRALEEALLKYSEAEQSESWLTKLGVEGFEGLRFILTALAAAFLAAFGERLATSIEKENTDKHKASRVRRSSRSRAPRITWRH